MICTQHTDITAGLCQVEIGQAVLDMLPMLAIVGLVGLAMVAAWWIQTRDLD